MPQSYRPSMRDETVEKKTGRQWNAWFALLDQWGAKEQGHKATARFLGDAHGVPGWWAQTITVEYERARGLRAVGQTLQGDHGFSVQRTVPVPPQQALEGWTDPHLQKRWVPASWQKPLADGIQAARWSETAMGTVLRFELEPANEDPSRLEVAFTPKDPGRTVVRVAVGRLTQKRRAQWKPLWTTAMDAYREALDGQ